MRLVDAEDVENFWARRGKRHLADHKILLLTGLGHRRN